MAEQMELAVIDAQNAVQRKEQAEREKREANAKLRAKIHREITSDIRDALMVDPNQSDRSENVTDALLSGKIRHVKVVF